jgi:hypothetical protein
MKYTFLVLAVLLSGCGLSIQQKSDATRVAKATSTVGDFSAEQLIGIRKAVIDLQVAYYKIDSKAKCLDTGMGTCAIPLDGGLSTQDLEARLAVAQALSAYGNALDSLINADHSEDLLKAANELGDSLGSAAEKSGGITLSDDDVEAISALTNLAGRWHVESKRKRALKGLAGSYANVIRQVAPLLERDFELQWNSPCRPEFQDGRIDGAPASGDSNVAGILDVHCLAAYNLKRKARMLIDSASTAHDLRASAVEGYVLAHNAQSNGWIVSQRGSALIKQLNKSAEELEQVAQNRKYQSKDLKQLGKDVKTLTSSLKLLIEK